MLANGASPAIPRPEQTGPPLHGCRLLQLDKNWKGQDSRQLLKIYDAIEDRAEDYESCKEKEGTYRFRTRRNRRERASSDDDDDSGSQAAAAHSHHHPPHPSPEPSGSGSGSPQQTKKVTSMDRLPSLTPAPESE
ncbi:hypothetical protein R3P38DRAFT_3239734 [Favolaschia claudopus]|uniref:Uncharacterized protein n=1 Tax=Favolaschia claudopus TaxID=2862362 RepID=A0AAV9Z851_9AGAR